MKRYRIVFRKSSQEDLRSIYRYVLDQSKNPEIAKAYIKRIRDQCERIGEAPFGGVARDDLGPDIRMAVFEKRVVILYIVENDVVRITNLFSGGRDYETLLKS